MKSMPLFVSLLIFIFSCQKEITNTDNMVKPIALTTDKNSYNVLDTLNINLNNNSRTNILIGLRCGASLELYCQKKENNDWIDIDCIGYMSLRCLTTLDTIESNNTFFQILRAEDFGSNNTFRLFAYVNFPREDSTAVIISNEFQIH